MAVQVLARSDVQFDTDHTGLPHVTFVQDGTDKLISARADLGAWRAAIDAYGPTGETCVTFYNNGRRLPENAKALSKRVVCEAFGAVLIAEYSRQIAKLEELRPDHARLAWHKQNVKEHARTLEEGAAYDVSATVCAVSGLAKAVRLAQRLARMEG